MSYGAYILLSLLLASVTLVFYVVYLVVVAPCFSPLRDLPGPPSGWLGTHLHLLLDASRSAQETEKMVKQYGRNFRVQGFGRVRCFCLLHGAG